MDTNDPHIGPVGSESPPRHSATPLITPGGSARPGRGSFTERSAATPIASASVDAVGQDVANIDGRLTVLEQLDLNARIQRLSRDVLIVGLLAIIALAAILVLGIFTFGNRHTLDQMRAMQAIDDTRHAQIETVQHNALCTALRTQAGTYSPTARVNDPAGTVHYDATYISIRASAATLGCVL